MLYVYYAYIFYKFCYLCYFPWIVYSILNDEPENKQTNQEVGVQIPDITLFLYGPKCKQDIPVCTWQDEIGGSMD